MNRHPYLLIGGSWWSFLAGWLLYDAIQGALTDQLSYALLSVVVSTVSVYIAIAHFQRALTLSKNPRKKE